MITNFAIIVDLMKINFRNLNLVLLCSITMCTSLLYPCKVKAADLTVGSSPCSYSTITSAIAAAGTGDRLLIEGGVTFDENIFIDRDLTLQGSYTGCGSGSLQNTTIDGGGTDRVVDIEHGLNVTLNNLNITNGNASFDGGGIRFAASGSNGTLTLTAVNIYDNTAWYGGGLWVGANADVNGENIQIYDNTANTYGGGVRLYGGNISLTISNIYNNTAPRGGGVYGTREGDIAPELYLLSSADIYGNEALTDDGFGGGVYMSEGTIRLEDASDIRDNNAIQGGGAYLVSSVLTIDGGSSEIEFNSVTGHGGGIYATTGSTVNLDDSAALYHNTAGSDGSGYGGGAYLDDSALWSDKALIIYNTAAGHGGGVYATNNSEFDMDLGDYTCLTQRCSQLKYNSVTNALNYGGGVYASADSSIDLRQTFIEKNSAYYGGAIYASNSQVDLYNTLIAENDATGGTGDGIRLYDGATMTGAHNTIAYNDYGGAETGEAIAIDGATTTMTLSNSIIWGHATSIDGSTQTVAYSDIQGGYGGAGNLDVNPLFISYASRDFHLQETSPVIDSCASVAYGDLDFDNEPRPLASPVHSATPYDMGADEFSTPKVGINGGGSVYGTLSQAVAAADDGDTLQVAAGTITEAVVIDEKDITISGGYDSTCTTPGAGDTILDGQYHSRSVVDVMSSVVILNGMQITGGNSTYGGGIEVRSNSQVTLDNIHITGNTGAYGGGLYINGSEVTLTNGTVIDDNTATIIGGGVRIIYDGILNSQDTYSDIKNNIAPDGGGIAVTGGELHLIDSDLENNQATATNGRGGAILLEADSTATMTGNVWIRGNQANNGAGIYADDSEAILEETSILGNTAANKGGGIYLTNSSSLSASDTKVGSDSLPSYGNEAGNGGGIYASASVIDFSGTIFNNLAAFSGAGIYGNDSTINLTDTSLGGTDENQPNKVGSTGYYGAGLYLNGTQATLNNTIVSGNTFQASYAYGGGAYLTGNSVLTLNDSTIENHLLTSQEYGRGAGIYINSSEVTIDNSRIAANSASRNGGGVRLIGTGTLNVRNDSVIENNHALTEDGGGISAADTTIINISHASLVNNSAATYGGAIYRDAGVLNMAYTRLHGNSASDGGAIFQTGDAVSEVSNSLIYGNTSTDGSGAGIRTEDGAFTMSHVTLANNIDGAGYSQDNTAGYVENSIAWTNSSGGFLVTSDPMGGTCNIDQSGNAGSSINPNFVNAAGNDFHLPIDSPAVDACSTGLSPDLDNIPRPFEDDYDMGAYEFYLESTVAVVSNSGEGGTVSGSGNFVQGSTVTVTASPAPGYTFVSWMVGETVVSTNPSYSFVLTDDIVLQANFKRIALSGIIMLLLDED